MRKYVESPQCKFSDKISEFVEFINKQSLHANEYQNKEKSDK